MSITVRPAGLSDLDRIIPLLLADAEDRRTSAPKLWKPKRGAREAVAAAVTDALENANPSFRQRWLVAEADGRIVGVAHTIRLPVPPIYAGAFGAPGLIMEDCALAGDAPPETAGALLEAAEADLIQSGAEVLVASSVVGGVWEREYPSRGHTPLTLYFTRAGLPDVSPRGAARWASVADVPAIVALSATNQRILFGLHGFWRPHPEARQRFGAWMERSLTLSDRDMFVAEARDGIDGYAISQPATPLHFPPAHDISGVGFIDDFFHRDFEDVAGAGRDARGAADLLLTAETALAARGSDAVLIVCPADWTSKRRLLEATGHRVASVWYIKA